MEYELSIGGDDAIELDTVSQLYEKRNQVISFVKEMKGKSNLKGLAAAKFNLPPHEYYVKNIAAILNSLGTKIPANEEGEEPAPLLNTIQCNIFTEFMNSSCSIFKSYLNQIQHGNMIDESVLRIVESFMSSCCVYFQNTYHTKEYSSVSKYFIYISVVVVFFLIYNFI